SSRGADGEAAHRACVPCEEPGRVPAPTVRKGRKLRIPPTGATLKWHHGVLQQSLYAISLKCSHSRRLRPRLPSWRPEPTAEGVAAVITQACRKCALELDAL